MNNLPERAADIKCGILSIWILQRQFPDATDNWDGNWLNIIVHCSNLGASVTVSGSILRLEEIKEWSQAIEVMDRELKGTAQLLTIEPNLAITLECNQRGQITAKCQITPDQLTQTHEFIFEIDQSYLKGIVSQCRKVLQTYELREPQKQN
jgi:hypothetical protein